MEHVGRVFILVQTFFFSFNIWSFGCNLICMSMVFLLQFVSF